MDSELNVKINLYSFIPENVTEYPCDLEVEGNILKKPSP